MSAQATNIKMNPSEIHGALRDTFCFGDVKAAGIHLPFSGALDIMQAGKIAEADPMKPVNLEAGHGQKPKAHPGLQPHLHLRPGNMA